MKISNGLVAAIGMAFLLCLTGNALASGKSVKAAETKMMTACTKDFPDMVKGKSFKDVAEWVETEEHGTDAEKFKTTDCYKVHEHWEKVAKHHEKGEGGEHKHKHKG